MSGVKSLALAIIVAALACGRAEQVFDSVPLVPSGGAGGEGGAAGGEGGQGCETGLPGTALVHYVVYHEGEEVLEGDIPIGDPASTVSILVGGLPPGEHELKLFASVPGECAVACQGFAPLTVHTGLETSVGVDLQCSDEDEDGVVVTDRGSEEARCKLDILRYFTALPLVTRLGEPVTLTAGADDLGGEQPVYAWTSTAGSIADPEQPNTTFSCDGVEGTHRLTLTVSGEVDSVPCEQSVAFDVECVATCGNGLVDPGETCDPADSATSLGCPDDCTLPVCGDGVIESEEQCEPPDTAHCDSACKDASSSCGDGVIESEEQCEPPSSAECDTRCRRTTAG